MTNREAPSIVHTAEAGVDTAFMAGGGEMGALIRAKDWESTPLGPIRAWPQSLRTAVSICIHSRFPIVLFWGPQLVQFYNDAYLPITVGKHPRSLGQPALECWAEVRDLVGPMLLGVLTRGEATWNEDLLMPLDRGDGPKESYFTFTYSPITDESKGVGGVFCAVVETTERVIQERRLRLLNALVDTTQAKTPAEACTFAAAQIERAPSDVPFALLYLLDEVAGVARLAGTAHVQPGGPLSPTEIPSSGRGSPWPFAQATARGGSTLVSLDAGPHGTHAAVILPIERSGGGRRFGFIVAGLSPMLRKDAAYDQFHNLLSAGIAQAVNNAAAYEEEKSRADALTELDRAKTTFFSNVSHEFRTPLALMLAPIQDMQSLPEDARIDRNTVDLLHRNALRLLKLVNTLLEFSRIEAGRVEAVYEPLDIATLTAELASSFRAAVERAGLALVVDCPPLPEPIYVDRDMWEKIVLNLLSNAFKFTFEGSITVRTKMLDDGVSVQIADTGTGIEDDELPRLFERFHRIEGARSRSHEGSGIGLALCQELVRLHGGTVRVTSQVGKGTCFDIWIPRGFAHLPGSRLRAARVLPSTALGSEAYVKEALRWVTPPASGSQAPEPLAAASGPRERILVADDNADMRDYLGRLLGERWEVEAVGDGVAALESIRHRPPALLLCDVMMPRLDGFALARTLRSDSQLRALPIIMLSARAGEEESAKGLSAGANDYIAKPFGARDLLVRVAAALASARVAREMRALEEAQREYLHRLFEHAPVGIAVLRGPDHVFEVANPHYAALVPGHRLLHRPIREALPELAGEGIYELLDRVYETGKPYLGRSIRLTVVGADALPEERFFDFAYQPIPNHDGKSESILVVMFEVTDLARARHDADAANRAKDEFFAILGHELRNPLAPIATALQLMRMRDDGSWAKERAVIERQVRQITRLVDDLLDVSRITRGLVKLERVQIELSEVVAKALEMAAPRLEERKHRLDVDVPPTGLGLDADPARMTQVVSNLLTNAAKYTEPGGHVRISAERAGGRVLLRVTDSGIGIASDMLSRVFEPFTQERQALDRAPGGLGLGLTVVASLVKLHGGSASVQSGGRGLGSTFTIDLPFSDASTRVSPAAVSSSVRRAESHVMRVLVVDDNEDAAEMLAEAIGMLGCEVRVANDGPAAIAVADEWVADVALLDIGLPVMDGYELAARLRNARRGEPLRLVAITGYGRSPDRARAASAGFDVHLVKPVDLDRIAEVLDGWRGKDDRAAGVVGSASE